MLMRSRGQGKSGPRNRQANSRLQSLTKGLPVNSSGSRLRISPSLAAALCLRGDRQQLLRKTVAYSAFGKNDLGIRRVDLKLVA